MCLLCTLLRGRMERKHDVCKKVAIAATVGMTVGIVTGILLAPKAGKKTREELLKKIQELPDKAKGLSEKTQEKLGEVKEKITEETQKIVSGVKEKVSDIEDEMAEDSRFQKPTEITGEQVDAFKKKLK